MLGLIFMMLVVLGLLSLFVPYSLLGGASQILLICALAVLGIRRFRAVRNRIEEYRLD